MTDVPTVLVPLDGSSNAVAALIVARGLAHVIGATVTLIYVGREPLSPEELFSRNGLSADDALGLIIEPLAGPLADTIVHAVSPHHAAFVVLGVQPADPSYPFGGLPGDVLRGAPCPVVLVPSDQRRCSWALRQLVLPHDGTPISAAAIGPTADLASRAGADLVVIHVATPDAARPTEPGTFTTPRYLDQPHHEWPMWAHEFLGRVRCCCHLAETAKIRLVLGQGDVSSAILEFAYRHGSDLIAVAWRGCAEPRCAQTMRHVLRGAPCPVIVFRVRS